jgi:hypothetical protein
MITNQKILSIDWDYFYPDSIPYDMGHSENHSPMLANMLWQFRVGNRNLKTGEELFEAYKPSVPDGFWETVLAHPTRMVVADSHFHIWKSVLEEGFGAQVVSMDAHHDCGYRPLKDLLDCSNWAAFGKHMYKIGRFHLYYPAWRKDAQEGRKRCRINSVHYGTLPERAEYDTVVVCRSGAWTTPWHDADFLAFVKGSGCEVEFLDDMAPRMTLADVAEARKINEGHRKLMVENGGSVV